MERIFHLTGRGTQSIGAACSKNSFLWQRPPNGKRELMSGLRQDLIDISARILINGESWVVVDVRERLYGANRRAPEDGISRVI